MAFLVAPSLVPCSAHQTILPERTMSNDPNYTQSPPRDQRVRVIVTDVDISFGQAVTLLLKFAFAAIPATIILTLAAGVALLVLALISAVLGLK